MKGRCYGRYSCQFTDRKLNHAARTLLSPDTQERAGVSSGITTASNYSLSPLAVYLQLVLTVTALTTLTLTDKQCVFTACVKIASTQVCLLIRLHPVQPPAPTACGAVKPLGPELPSVLWTEGRFAADNHITRLPLIAPHKAIWSPLYVHFFLAWLQPAECQRLRTAARYYVAAPLRYPLWFFSTWHSVPLATDLSLPLLWSLFTPLARKQL